MAEYVMNRFKKELLDALASETVQVMLVTSSYTPNADHDFVDNGANDATDPSFNEIAVTNYTAGFSGTGRKTLASKTFTEVDASDRAEFDAADVTWTALGTGATIARAVVYKRGSADTDSEIVSVHDVTSTPTNGGDFGITWAATGVLTLS
jgi:hypothetical protein